MAAAAVPEVMVTQTCLVCLEEVEALKVIGECSHAFCQPCLERHLKDKDLTETFPCPSCNSDCRLPEDGVGNLPDLTLPEEAVEDVGSDDASDASDEDVEPTGVMKKDCFVCQMKNASTSSPAKKFCEKCDMYLCDECGGSHGKRAGTKNHELTDVYEATRESAGICRRHGLRLKMYCRPCAVPCCSFCTDELNHGDHDVCQFVDALATALDDFEKVIESGKVLVQELETAESVAVSSMKVKDDWKESVISEVEQKAEDCINNITEQKDKLIATIRQDCETTKEYKCLNDVATIRGSVVAKINEGEALLLEPKADVKYMKSLSIVKETIEKDIGSKESAVPKISFVSRRPRLFSGGVKPGAIGAMSTNEVTTAQLLTNIELRNRDKQRVFPVMCCLGNVGYAVISRQAKVLALKSSDRELQKIPDKLLVFEMDGQLRRSLKVPTVHGMDVNSKERVVILLPGKEGMFSFKVYNTVKDTSEQSKMFPLPTPLSMSISPEGWCYVLCTCEGVDDARVIFVVDMGGIITQHSPISGTGVHTKITCSRKNIYTSGGDSFMVAVCGMVGGKVTLVRNITVNRRVMDITANWFDDVFVTCKDMCYKLVKGSLKDLNLNAYTIHVHNYTLLVKNWSNKPRAYRLK